MKQMILLFTFLVGSTLSAQIWESDYDSALAFAKKTERPLIVVFAGSDWCAPCIKLDREIWQSDVFKVYAADNYVVYRADFPRKKKNQLAEEESLVNAKLAEKFNPNGYFPLVVVMDAQENVLGTTSYKHISPKAYIDHLNSFL